MKKNKIMDLRTLRGQKIRAKIAEWYISFDYGIDPEIVYAEGYSYVIKTDGTIMNCKPRGE